jgi:hypothetical protein
MNGSSSRIEGESSSDFVGGDGACGTDLTVGIDD